MNFYKKLEYFSGFFFLTLIFLCVSIITPKEGLKMNERHYRRRKYKLYKGKRFIATITTIATLLGTGYVVHLRLQNKRINSNEEYVIGYKDIGIANSITNRVTENNFVLLDIGDHNSIGTFFQNAKLDYCVEKGIKIGLIVSSNSFTLSDIYLDLEYVMGIMEQYKISYPIYFCVDSIMNCERLSFDMAKNLVKSFLEKAEANHIYVGFCGSQENMNLLDDFSSYDRFVINGDVKIGSIYEREGIYYDGDFISSVIDECGYNDSSCFSGDEYYVLKEGDTLKKVASLYGISVSDLRKYQDGFFKKFEKGDVLRIPSLNHNYNHHLNANGEFAKVGIDVSLWQGDIRWQEVDVDYAIIQVRDFANIEKDPCFEENVWGCLENGIPMGFYAFSRAVTQEEVEKEAEYVVSQLQGIPVTYPVYLDLETDFWHSIDANGCLVFRNYNAEETKNFVLNFLQTWEREILKAGYVPGIYCNYALLERLNLVTDNYLENMQCWIAGGEYYDQVVSYGNNHEIPVIDLEENEKIAMKQISGMGMVSGIDNYVDLNYCYTDYETNYQWERKKFSKWMFPTAYGVSVLTINGVALIFRKKKKKKRVKNRSYKL